MPYQERATMHKPQALWRKPGNDCEGFVVGDDAGYYLGHDMVWYIHTGPETAYVHSLRTLLAGGDWTERANFVLHARYDGATDSTVVVSEEQIAFDDFLEDHVPETLL